MRILVFSASYGAGHLRAAEAIIEEIKHRDPDVEIMHTDWGQFISHRLNKVVENTYIGMIRYTPKLWGRIYSDTAKIPPDSNLQSMLYHLWESTFLEYISKVTPDLIICTYPIVAGILAQLKMKDRLRVPLVTVVTDYAVHKQWVHPGVDLYIAGCENVYQELVAQGIDAGQIKVTGIPVSRKFEIAHDRARIKANLGLNPELPTFLIMGGAFGVLKDIGGICRLMGQLSCQTMVVCGKNNKLYKMLDDIVAESQHPFIRFGYVTNVEELMSASEAIVTKAGGLIVSEALTKHLPIFIYKPIPGQEAQNSTFVSNIGAGAAIKNLREFKQMVSAALNHPDHLARMRLAAKDALPGQAAERAVTHMLELIG